MFINFPPPEKLFDRTMLPGNVAPFDLSHSMPGDSRSKQTSSKQPQFLRDSQPPPTSFLPQPSSTNPNLPLFSVTPSEGGSVVVPSSLLQIPSIIQPVGDSSQPHLPERSTNGRSQRPKHLQCLDGLLATAQMPFSQNCLATLL